MDKIKQSILAIVIGLSLAAGVSFAWTGAPGNPPNPNTGAPINVGPSAQAKSGFLSIGTNMPPIVTLNVNGPSNFSGLSQFNYSIKIPTGAGTGKVLTSDSAGIASWQDSNSKFKTYQSGWTPIAIGETKTFSHMLGTFNTIVYIEGKDAAGQIHQTKLGSDDGQGLKMTFKTDNTVDVKRGALDGQCNNRNCWKEVRVQMLGW